MRNQKRSRDINWNVWTRVPDTELWKAVALSLGIDPGGININEHSWMVEELLFTEDREFDDRLIVAESNLNLGDDTKSLHAVSIGTSKRTCTISLAEFAAWALSIDWKIPEELAAMAKTLHQYGIAWEGFDPDSDNYPYELDVALQGWRAVTKKPEKGTPPKEQIRNWLRSHYPDLTKEAIERIATVCNWEKRGGRPSRI